MQKRKTGKRIVVTGGMGMIGKELVELLRKKYKTAQVIIADIKNGYDLTKYDICKKLCENADEVYHLAGIKGNPKKTKERPVDFMKPMLLSDTNMICAAQEMAVNKFLYTSSIAVEHPETDFFPAWAKRTGEHLIQAMRIQYPQGTDYCVVRPANVYGKYDNFSNPDAMVITAFIRQAQQGEIILYGQGNAIRDFIHAKDVAKGMTQAMEEQHQYPVNVCSGIGVTIKRVAEMIAKQYSSTVTYKPLGQHIIGEDKRVMKINWNFKPTIELQQGLEEVIRHAKKSI